VISISLRTRRFVVRVFSLLDDIPHSPKGRVVQYQLARCSSSGAANYRAAQRSRSRAEFISKLSIALEEIDESNFWIELLIDTRMISPQKVTDLLKEGQELFAILLASRNTARRNTLRNVDLKNPSLLIHRPYRAKQSRRSRAFPAFSPSFPALKFRVRGLGFGVQASTVYRSHSS
jgi:four helix bundle protein